MTLTKNDSVESKLMNCNLFRHIPLRSALLENMNMGK